MPHLFGLLQEDEIIKIKKSLPNHIRDCCLKDVTLEELFLMAQHQVLKIRHPDDNVFPHSIVGYVQELTERNRKKNGQYI